MIYAAILNIEKMPQELPLPKDETARSRISLAKNEELRRERIAAYLLAERAYSDFFSLLMPPLSFDKHEKPGFTVGEIKISISHTDGFCAVAFSKNDVGIDVQSHAEMLEKERVLERFVNKDLQNLIKNSTEPNVTYLFYETKEQGIEIKPMSEIKDVDFSSAEPSAVWSALEAVLKCRGGFCEFKNVENLVRAAKIKTVDICGASLSVAEL